MVRKVDGWFVYEVGDVVQSLNTSQKGIVVEQGSLDMQKREQIIYVQFKEDEVKRVSSDEIDLVKRTAI